MTRWAASDRKALAAAAAGADDGEVVEINLQTQGSTMVLTCGLSRDLRDVPNLFATDFRVDDDLVSSSIFGTGFALRLAKAEARAVGGDLRRVDTRLVLTLPVGQPGHNFAGGSPLAA